MTGKTQLACAIKELDTVSKQQEKGSLPEQFSIKLKQELTGHYKCGGLELRALSRAKEYTQREAVIRPQQAGKIDFKSLQNRPKFSSDRTWLCDKGSPQSPSGKSRTRDKSKRSGKAERGNPQQLYRLSISNPRANPTIGIAYPQQKVTPKKLETGRSPISGSYRFHVPSIPEREAELQQEELSYNRCFQEASSNLTSTNFTSHADSNVGSTPVHQHPVPQQQQPGPRENSSSQPSSQLLFPEFPVNRATSWQSPEKSFSGANYGVSSQKLTIFSEGDKVNAGIVPLPFQYGFPSLQDADSDPFPSDQNTRPQDYLDISLANAQVTHSSFTFHSSGEGQDDLQADSQFSNKQPEGRSSYPQLPQHAQYLQSPHEAQSSLHCHKGRSKHPTNSENSVLGLHKLDQNKSTVPDNPGTFNEVDGEGVALMSLDKQSCPPTIESTTNQRILTQGNTHHARSIAHGQSSQMLSPSKTYSSSPVSNMHVGPVPLEESIPGGNNKNQSRLLETWEGANKTFSSMDQNSALYSTLNDKCQFQCQPAVEQRQSSSNSRMAWQQIQLTSAMPKQNRIHLSRQLSNQKLTFPIGAFDWQESKEVHKNSPLNSFHDKRPNEAFTNRRPESITEHSNISAFPFDQRVEAVSSPACEGRNKPMYFGVSQNLPGPYSKANSHTPSQVSPVGLMTAAPHESPLSSPLHNPASTSPCSSVSPASHSPVNISPDDSQVLIAGPPPPLYHHNQDKTLMPLDHLNSNLHHFTDLSRTFPNSAERAKEDMLSYMHNNKCTNPNMDGDKSCLNSYGVEHPPPPYSAHQLLASSLAAANLDQLDVLLTCKQCDQNFNNLASFLDHKQYCGQHMLTQNNNSKCIPKMEEHRKYQTDCTKTPSSGMGFPLSRCPSDPHLSLLGLSKNGELMSDPETKADPKYETSKLNFFSGTNTLPVTLPDLEMDDAKLDSLITEALNGLGYQSDNAEIDSSFIDAFVDDDLTTSMHLKTKDYVVANNRSKHEATIDQGPQTQGKHLYDSDKSSMSAESKHTLSFPEKTRQDFNQKEKANSKEVTPHKKSRGLSSEKLNEQKEWIKEEIMTGEKNKRDSRFLLSRKFSERCKLKSFPERSSLILPSLTQASYANWSTVTPRVTVKERKRRKAGGGTWSKELIHKIVQQKNKPHKLHVKETKGLQFSLVTKRLTPTVQSPKFREYDYVSDSDEESQPLRLTSYGRLGHTGRCRYTYSKEYKGKYTYSKDKGREWADKEQAILWKHQSKESDEVKVADDIFPPPVKETSVQKMRRRFSSSSELSEPTSISSESITSPKTTDRTDSESEKGLPVKSSINVPLSDSFVLDNCKRSLPDTRKESTTPIVLSSHQFSKNTKRYGSAKFLHSTDKGPLPSSKVLSSRARSTESMSELHKTSSVRSLGGDHCTGQLNEGQHSAAVSMTEKPEETSFMKRGSRVGSSCTGTPADFHTTGAHCKLLAEVIPDTNSTGSKNSIKNKKRDISARDNSTYKRSDHSTPSNYSVVLQPSAEITAIPAFEKIGDAVYTSNEEMHNVDCDVIPNSTPHCTAHAEEVCLCPLDMQGPAAQDKQGNVPFPIEPDQSLIKSPLSFDTSSMFGDLTVGGFDNSLYTGISKEGFNTFSPRNDKRELFESSSHHLGLKDWDIMADIPPMLPEEISHFKDLTEKETNQKSNSSYIHLSLSDKIMEDNSNFISGLSADELEIKRIVTELETQLQTAKLSSSPLLPNKVPKQLSRNDLSSLPLDHDAGNEQSSMPVVDNEETRRLSASSPSPDPNCPLWSSPFQLGLLEGQQNLHTPVHGDHSTLEHSCIKEDPISTESAATKELQPQEMKGTDRIKNPSTDCLQYEEMLENEMYTENLMKSLEVISDSIFNKGSLSTEIEKSDISQFLNHDQPWQKNLDAGEKQSKKEGTLNGVDKSHKSEKHDTIVFPNENADCSSDARGDLSPEPRESETKFESGSKVCEDISASENVISVNECQKNTDLLIYGLPIIDKNLKDDNILLPKISEFRTKEEGEGVLEDKECPSQPPQLFVSSNIHPNDKEMVMTSYPTVLTVDQSSIVPEKSKEEDNLPPLSLEDYHSLKEKPEHPGHSDSPKRSTIYDAREGGAEDLKNEKSMTFWDLQKVIESEEVELMAINEEAHKAPPLGCNTPDHAAADSAAQVDQERTTNMPCIVDQERTIVTSCQMNQEMTTDTPYQVDNEKTIDMPFQVEREKTIDIPYQVKQKRTMDVVCPVNQERNTDVPCQSDQKRTTDVPCQVNQDRTTDTPYQGDQERTTDVPCQVDQQRTTDMLYQADQERTKDIPCQVDQARTTDVLCQVDQQRTTDVPCQVDQERTTDVPCQVDQQKTTDVPCSLLSAKAEVKHHEKPEVTNAEHASTLPNESLMLMSINKTETEPECTSIPTQDLSALTVHAMSTNNAVMNKENKIGALSQPLSSSLPYSEDPSVVQQSQSQTIWDNFDRLSPVSIHYEQSPKRGSCDELISREMQSGDPPVTMMTGMPNIAALPDMDIDVDENKRSRPESDSIPTDFSLNTTVELTNHSLVKSQEPIKNGVSETLGPMSELKQNPQIYNEISPHPEYSSITQTLSENLDAQGLFMPLSSICAISPTLEDKSSSERRADSDTLVCLYSQNSSLQNISTQSSTKLSCSTVPCPQYTDSSVPSITNVMLGLNHKTPQDIHNLDSCHLPLETIDYMDLHIDLLKKVEAEKQDLHASPPEQNALLCQQEVSSSHKTLQPILDCAEVASEIPPCQSEAVKAEEGQCESNQMDAKRNFNDSRKKSTVQKKNSTQGTILCEICFACFRTVPGLKRHKAMKHFTKKNGNTAMDNLQGSVNINKDDPALLDPQVYLHADRCNSLTSEANVPSFIVNEKELPLNVILGGAGTIETSKTMMPEAKEKHETFPPIRKAKKNGKAQKSREIDRQNGCFEPKIGKSSPFSDELLSILKTDILQAITPDFPSTPQKSSCLSEKKDKTRTTEFLEVTVPEHIPFKLIESPGKKDIIITHKENHNAHKQGLDVSPIEAEMEGGGSFKLKMFCCDETTENTISSEFKEAGEDYQDLKVTCKQNEICLENSLEEVSFKVKCEKATCITDRVDPQSCSFKAPSVCTPEPDPDLEALLDDERTFSQLFPRDEEMIRKKCAKVYGKRNKKQNADSNLPLRQACPADSISSNKKEQHSESNEDQMLITKMRDCCEYETIFIDDAIMLDMRHKSTVKNDCEKICHMSDQHEEDVSSGRLVEDHFLCLTKDPLCKTAKEWSSSRDLTDSVVKRVQSSETPISCKTEEPATPCSPQRSDPSGLHSNETPAQENTSHFHGIDIQNLNTKFQLPEIQFLESSEEVPVILPITSDDMTINQSTQTNKKPAERRGRRRMEGSTKPKDKQYKCKVCFTWFLTLGELNFHKLSHNPSPPPTCYMCVQRKFSSREQLRDHLREKHARNKAGVWTCGMCLKEISDVWMYNEHLREHATQFARKGQTQSSILGLPGCFMQETAVKNFITSIMQHQTSKCNRGETGKMSSKEGAKTAKENVQQDPKTSEGGETTGVKSKGSSGGVGKRNTPILSDIPHKADTPQKNVEMHPNCKDPSRDCHHCGKQFPKPFKLQRHLVVHSLQKIFLCSRCPISYQDAKELKDHLKSEHEEMEEPDSKHTTLYTCELCADVMHVIKKSFICSTCNYTFSKKEQFDRHMEKHLSGGNKIFKFRGVMRPSKAPSSFTNDGEFDLPPSKRRKLRTDSLMGNNTDNSIPNIASTQFGLDSEPLIPRPMSPTSSDFTNTSDDPSTGSKDASIKTEDIARDFPQLQVVSGTLCLPEVSKHSSASGPAADEQTGEACEGDEKPSLEICDIKEENHLHSSHTQNVKLCNSLKKCRGTKNEAGSSLITMQSTPEDIVSANTAEAKVQEMDMSDSVMFIEESHDHLNENLMKISESQNLLKEDRLACCSIGAQQKSPEGAVELTGGYEKREHYGEVQRNESEEKELKIVNEQQKDGQAKEEVLSKPRDCGADDSLRPAAGGTGVIQSAKNCVRPTALSSGRNEEKDSVRQQKKRKEVKMSQSSKVSSSATRENQDVDIRNRKRVRVQSPSKCIWTGSHRKADATSDYSVLSSVRDDMASNKILPKHKTGGLNLQPKRNSIDSNPPKKVDSTRHGSGTYKGRKGVAGRPLHPQVSKTSVPIVNNFNKYRTLSGVRPVESHSYRTAESQNHLLSQLFGQKLTSFKIPLRKDTSEALN